MQLSQSLKSVWQPRHILFIIIGNLLVAFASVFFILPGNILSGGVTTVSILLNHFIPISRVALIFILNVSLFIIGAIFLGKSFAISSILSTILYPLFVSLLSMLDTAPFGKIDPILSALYAGLITGSGLGLVFRVNASTGGMDIPALLLHKYAGIPTSRAVMFVDALTILSGLWVYGVSSILTGLVAVMASSFAINYISTYGGEEAQNVMIISEKWPEIEDTLLHQFDRGVTLLDGRGAWSNESRPVLMCVVRKREYGRILREVAKIDPKAFIIANSVHEVRGQGFTIYDEPYVVPHTDSSRNSPAKTAAAASQAAEPEEAANKN